MIKQIVLNILAYLKGEVEEDRCTPEQLRGMYKMVSENMPVNATISDIAKHYGQSESNVRNVAARSYRGKPKRRVYYDMVKFSECAPSAWHKRKEQQTTA